MSAKSLGVELSLGTPATYRISVQGDLSPDSSDRLAGMRIQSDRRPESGRVSVTTLEGRLTDQAQLIGVVNALYERRLPLLSIELLHAGDS